ncbi:SRPBCC family protein [Phytomonospora sp. NPDC050363]|uniref:SRPBCC family protein n=1 Tax=Phytomonospora sp. NPDC050363 TaxID=3155642 RepID=UPI0033F75C7A
MAHTRHVIKAPVEDVFAVLSDGWTYSDWVVGTAHIREVDEAWPEAGSRMRVTTGPWPLLKHAETVSLECTPPTRLVMRPKAWPFGELTVSFRLVPEDDGSTMVHLHEEISAGPLHWIRTKVDDLLLHRRNKEALRRLADIVVNRGPQ